MNIPFTFDERTVDTIVSSLAETHARIGETINAIATGAAQHVRQQRGEAEEAARPLPAPRRVSRPAPRASVFGGRA